MSRKMQQIPNRSSLSYPPAIPLPFVCATPNYHYQSGLHVSARENLQRLSTGNMTSGSLSRDLLLLQHTTERNLKATFVRRLRVH